MWPIKFGYIIFLQNIQMHKNITLPRSIHGNWISCSWSKFYQDLVRMNLTDRCSLVPDHPTDHLECPSPEALLQFPTTTSASRNISSLRLIGCSATPVTEEKEDAQLGSLLNMLTNVSAFSALRSAKSCLIWGLCYELRGKKLRKLSCRATLVLVSNCSEL